MIRNEQKNKMMRAAHRKCQETKIKQLATKNKDRLYYKLIDEMSNTGYGKHKQIQQIIKPNIAVRDDDVNWDSLTNYDYTKNSNDTANEVNHYINAVGNHSNPNYKSSLQTIN